MTNEQFFSYEERTEKLYQELGYHPDNKAKPYALQVCNAGDWPDVIDEACDSAGVHWQQGKDREWKATGYCCANCLEIDQRILSKKP